MYIFQQLLISTILFGYLQFKYLEYCHQEWWLARRTPIQARYLELKQRVLAVDLRLQQLNHSYLHSSNSNQSNSKSRLIHPNRLILSTRIILGHREPCSATYGNDLTLVVMVYNRVTDFRRRQAIRETFGKLLRKQNQTTRIYFVVGKFPPETTQFPTRLEIVFQAEERLYRDLIQLDFHEDYYNCTLKAIAIVRWIADYCPYTKYVLKLDDDSFVRVPLLLSELGRANAPRFIMGRLNVISSAFRGSKVTKVVNVTEADHAGQQHQQPLSSKWTVSRRDYPFPYYPPYIVGIYLVPGGQAIRLYEAIVQDPIGDTIPALAFDDVYLTGIVARKARLLRTTLDSQLLLKSANQIQRILGEDLDLLDRRYSILWNGLEAEDIHKFWEIFKNDVNS